MIRYLTVICMLVINSAFAGSFGICGYIPQSTADNPHPHWEIFEDCASWENAVLEISSKHLANLKFEEPGVAGFYAAEQHFYVKPGGEYLQVIPHDNGADPFQEGLTRSLLNGKIAYFDIDFELVLAPGYDWAWPFRDGRALVCNGCAPTPVGDGHTAMRGGLWGYIDVQGREVVPVNFSEAEVAGK